MPSAFTHTTGAAHWDWLLRARAVENQRHLLAPAQGGLHEHGRHAWGHSLLADPWGTLLGCRPEGWAVVAGMLDGDRPAAARRRCAAGYMRIDE